jgi:hypothetical protein
MTTELPSHTSLYGKLAAVSGAIAAVEKDNKNKDQGYRYASPASVMSAVKPLLAEHKLAIVPHLVNFEEIDSGQRASSGKPFVINRVSMHYHILDGETGDELVVPWQGQAGTYADDKGLAKAQTIALRTFLIQLFQIPTEDPENDPDARDAQPPARQPQRNAPAPRPAAAQPPKNDQIETIRTLWRETSELGQQIPPKHLTLDLATLNKIQLDKLETQARQWYETAQQVAATAEQAPGADPSDAPVQAAA